MRIIVLAAALLITLASLLGFWLKAQGLEKIGSISTSFWPIVFPAFGLFFTILIAGINRKILRHSWTSQTIPKPLIRPAIALLYGPVLAFIIHSFIALKYLGISNPNQMMVGFAILQIAFFFCMGDYATTIPVGSPGGFRTPWTLKENRVWTKTHRYIGRGLLMVTILSLLTLIFINAKYALFLNIAGVIGTKLSAVIYSYIVWRTFTSADITIRHKSNE